MSDHRANNLAAFRHFIDEQIAQGATALTPAQCLDPWEIENTSDEERAAAVLAVREALKDMRGGDTGMPAGEFLATLRRKYNLAATP